MEINGNSVHLNREYDPEIRVRDVLFHLLYRWRSILLVMILCAAVLGGWQYFRVNAAHRAGNLTKDEFRTFIRLLNPFAPHITDELWEMAGFEGHASNAPWPEYDEAMCADALIEIPIQVNGKLRGKVTMPADAGKDDILAAAKAEANVIATIGDKSIVKEIFVPGRMVNLIVK